VGLAGVRFESDGVWIKDDAGSYWSHTLGQGGPVLQWNYCRPHAEGEIAVLRRRLAPGSVLVDVGANIGTFSIQLARAVDGLQVLAVEPVPQVCDALRANIAKNRLDDAVRTAPVALSDGHGTVVVTGDLAACNYVVPSDAHHAPPDSERVAETTLDDLVEEYGLKQVDFIKCDVEGMELRVLRGAQSVLERFSPELLLEIDERWTDRYGYHASEIFEFLDQRGYDYHPVIDGEIVERTAGPDADVVRTNDFLFTPRHGRERRS
jgi:FkbM family methyltransferase